MREKKNPTGGGDRGGARGIDQLDSRVNLTDSPSPSPLQIVVAPTTSGRKWTARLGERVICCSSWPFVMSARVLLAEGHPADAAIEMWRAGADAWALRGRLAAVAATLIDGETAKRCARNGAPVHYSGPGAATPVEPAP